MKKIIACFFLLVLGLSARAQVEVGGRASAGIDYKIVKGLHVSLEEEVRAGSNFSSLGSLRTTVGVDYKPVKYFKVGVGYTMINPYKASKSRFDDIRHRFMVDVTGYLPLGNFQISLKERLQLTHRTGSFNYYQTTPNALALKSRLMVKYKGWEFVKPSLGFEIRTALNDPNGTYQTAEDEEGNTYYKYIHKAYNQVYNNRYRIILNADIKLSKHHTLTPSVLVDYNHEYEIDTTSPYTEPVKFKSAGYNNYWSIIPCLSYTFSF